jgi:transcriptional regulator with XRE-family HTH domain
MNSALRLIRIFHELSQTDVAEALEMPKSWISELESGKRPVTLNVLRRYADYFELPLSSLVLFAETVAEDEQGSHKPTIAAKALRMLSWFAEGQAKEAPSR